MNRIWRWSRFFLFKIEAIGRSLVRNHAGWNLRCEYTAGLPCIP